MRSALPLLALATLVTTSVFGALSAAPIDTTLPGGTAALGAPAQPVPVAESSANLLFAPRPAAAAAAPARLADGHGNWFLGMFDQDDDDNDGDGDHGHRHGRGQPRHLHHADDKLRW